MIIEKLVLYQISPSEAFDRLIEAWEDQAFIIDFRDDEALVMHCSGKVGYQKRVDVVGICIPEGTGTVVQMIHSPMLSPAFSGPIGESTASPPKVGEDLETKMIHVINKIGAWESISWDAVKDHPERLEDPLTITRMKRKGKSGQRALLGLAIGAFGTLMAYLNLSEILIIGPYQVWFTIAVLGVVLLCWGLFAMVWRR
jgi:hypothetical protein